MLSEVRQQQPNKRNQRAAVSSEEEKLASGRKRWCQRDKDEPEEVQQTPAAFKEEEKDKIEVKEDGEDAFQRDKDELHDGRRPPTANCHQERGKE
jgi:hypothetical protein